jgi:sugar phosphate isomerase/epimerase
MAQTRRQFFAHTAITAAGALLWPGLEAALAEASKPDIVFPTQPRERISIASYPFRNFINGPTDDGVKPAANRMDIRDFAAHVIEKFKVNKIEPWSPHFPSTNTKYLAEFRSAIEKAHGVVVNIAADGHDSPYAVDSAERQRAVAYSKQWIDVAVAIGSPSVRTHIPRAKDSKPDVNRAADSIARVGEYAAAKKIVVHFENDDPVSEDPDFIVQLLDKLNSPWLRSNPDFANTLAARDEDYAYRSIDALFARAYGICHVKAMEPGEDGRPHNVDLAKTFGILKKHNYRGYCSMEFDSPGDPYAGTSELIEKTLQYLS